jgi:serine/threonine protein kinase
MQIRCHVIKVAMKEIIPDGGMRMEYFLAGWNREVTALRNIIDLDHPNLIRWIAAVKKGPKYYLMFEWADGGNLRSFWEKTTHSGLGVDGTRDMVRQTLLQWKGLADCLSKLHMEKKFRHGDIKPENILRFTGANTLGTLKIADFGLARRYDMDTSKRGATMTKSTTIEYESPETYEAVAANRGLSRLTDLWSVGCVLLEHIIWLLYGYNEVARFYIELQGKPQNKRPLYEHTASGKTKLRPRVTLWLNHMQRDERCTGTAIGRLLKFVQSNLLVTLTRPNWRAVLQNGEAVEDPPPNTRASAPEFYREMTEILSTDDPAYLFRGMPEFPRPPPPRRSGTTRINDLGLVEPNDNLGADLFRRNLRDTAAPEVPAQEFVIVSCRIRSSCLSRPWAEDLKENSSVGCVCNV